VWPENVTKERQVEANVGHVGINLFQFQICVMLPGGFWWSAAIGVTIEDQYM
jgi:hypothetical protein